MIIYSSENFYNKLIKLNVEELNQLQQVIKSQENQDETRASENMSISNQLPDKLQEIFDALIQLNSDESKIIKQKEEERLKNTQKKVKEAQKILDEKLNNLEQTIKSCNTDEKEDINQKIQNLKKKI